MNTHVACKGIYIKEKKVFVFFIAKELWMLVGLYNLFMNYSRLDSVKIFLSSIRGLNESNLNLRVFVLVRLENSEYVCISHKIPHIIGTIFYMYRMKIL